MPGIVSCQCGTRIRLPDGASGQSFRCPRCKAELPSPVAQQVVVTSKAEAGGAERFCPICQSAIGQAEVVHFCRDCGQVHHRDCWLEVGGCGVYGCNQAPSPAKEEPVGRAPRTAWGDTKKCPACKETIKAIALRCRYCGTDFSTVDPLSVDDLVEDAKLAEAARRAQITVSVLFGLSVIGCLAPAMLIANLAWVLLNLRPLAKAGPLYQVLGYSALVLSVVYCVLMLAFFLFSR